MVETLVILLTAHLFGDFVLQTDWVVSHKRKPFVLLLHAVLIAAVSALMLGNLPWALLLILIGSHVATDALKTYALPERLFSFLIDQIVHVGVILALAWIFRDAARNGIWMSSLPPDVWRVYLQAVTFFGGFLLCVPVGGALIGITTAPLLREIKEDVRRRRELRRREEEETGQEGQDQEYVEGLWRGGRYIGWLERSLVMMLLLMGQPGGIGFLFAAKSILRFGEIKDSHQRKLTEYIIIGTFLSFGWGLLTAYLTQQALTLWK